MDSLICKCCGGDIDPKTSTCRYCGTVYVKGYVCIEQTFDDCFKPIAAIDILTPNEMRDYVGFAPIVEKYYEVGGNGQITAMQRVVERRN